MQLLTIGHVPLKVVHQTQQQRHVTGGVVVYVCDIQRRVADSIAVAIGNPPALAAAVGQVPQHAESASMRAQGPKWPCDYATVS